MDTSFKRKSKCSETHATHSKPRIDRCSIRTGILLTQPLMCTHLQVWGIVLKISLALANQFMNGGRTLGVKMNWRMCMWLHCRSANM